MSDEAYTYCDVCGNRAVVMDCGCVSCNVCRLADEVINEGLHGTGQARRDSLGDDYNDVQNEINRRLGYSKRYWINDSNKSFKL